MIYSEASYTTAILTGDFNCFMSSSCHDCRQHGERSLHSCSMHGGRQTVVHAERTATQHGQVGGTHHWNHRSATRCRPAVSSVAVAGVELPVAEEMKVLGVVLDRRLTFEKHVTMVARSCHYHAQGIRHIRHLLSTELA